MQLLQALVTLPGAGMEGGQGARSPVQNSVREAAEEQTPAPPPSPGHAWDASFFRGTTSKVLQEQTPGLWVPASPPSAMGLCDSRQMPSGPPCPLLGSPDPWN